MADMLDSASDLEAREREAAISRAAGRGAWSGPQPEIINGVPCCRECGEPIPQERCDALPGVGLCVECVMDAERS